MLLEGFFSSLEDLREEVRHEWIPKCWAGLDSNHSKNETKFRHMAVKSIESL